MVKLVGSNEKWIVLEPQNRKNAGIMQNSGNLQKKVKYSTFPTSGASKGPRNYCLQTHLGVVARKSGKETFLWKIQKFTEAILPFFLISPIVELRHVVVQVHDQLPLVLPGLADYYMNAFVDVEPGTGS